MAQVQFTDIYNANVFAGRAQQAQVRLNNFVRSGIAVHDGALQAQVNVGGRIGEITHYKPLGINEPNYTSDDPTVTSTPKKVSSTLEKYRLARRHDSWSVMDVTREVSLRGQDPVGMITSRIGDYWRCDDEQRVINSLLGILADNAANDSSDMIEKVGNDTSADVTDAQRITGDGFIDAAQTLGDHKGAVTAMAIHSKVHARLQKRQLIDYLPENTIDIGFGTYLGKTLLVDDVMPAIMGTNKILYTCVLFGPGAVTFANGSPDTPSALERKESAGGGGGQLILHSRVSGVWHIPGFSFTSATITGSANNDGADYDDLKLAVNWDRVVDRKAVPIAFLQVND